MLDYKFNLEATYLLACTYGQDSMALLDMVQKEGVKPIVVCINYAKFENSTDDYIKLASYCGQKGLVLEYLDASSLPSEEAYQDGMDFKDWARKTRYAYFKKMYDKYDAVGLIIAHHQDDILEALLKQKERKSKDSDYALSPVTEINGMVVIRPLLKYTKQDLLEYDEENRVPFSTSKSAFEDQFTRSRIREQINAMSEIERANLLEEMEFANDDKLKMVEDFRDSIEDGGELEIRPLMALAPDEFASMLVHFIGKSNDNIALKSPDFQKIRSFCLSPVPFASLHLGKNTYLIKQYDVLILGSNYDEIAYSYTLEKPGKLSNEHFELDFSMGAEDRGIKESDYPLTIRTATTQDNYVVHGYLEPVQLLFSTWKMPIPMRSMWPIFLNKDGKVIYVPRYRRQFREYHTSILRMNLKDPER